MDQVKALRSTLKFPRQTAFSEGFPSQSRGGGGGGGGVQKADVHPQVRKGRSFLPRELQLSQEVQAQGKERTAKIDSFKSLLNKIITQYKGPDCMHGLAHHILNWGALTRDCWVLNTVQGYQIESQHCTGVPDRVSTLYRGTR